MSDENCPLQKIIADFRARDRKMEAAAEAAKVKKAEVKPTKVHVGKVEIEAKPISKLVCSRTVAAKALRAIALQIDRGAKHPEVTIIVDGVLHHVSASNDLEKVKAETLQNLLKAVAKLRGF